MTWALPWLSEADGVELFTERARRARPGFILRADDTDSVRSICRRLDGLPLAIELAAAARTRALAPARLAAHLQDHFRLLPSGPRTAPGRQATLRAQTRIAGGLGCAEAMRPYVEEAVPLARSAGIAFAAAVSLELVVALRWFQSREDNGSPPPSRWHRLGWSDGAFPGTPGRCARLWAAAESLRGELVYWRFPVDRPAYEAAVANARQALGADESGAAWAEVAELLPDSCDRLPRPRSRRARRPSTGWASLTPSELEVVRMVGQHLSNPEIASRLFVSRAPVKTHLVHIFAKLDIDSRSELVAEDIRRRV